MEKNQNTFNFLLFHRVNTVVEADATLGSVQMGITSKHSPSVLKSKVSLGFVTIGTTEGLSNDPARKILAIPEKVE